MFLFGLALLGSIFISFGSLVAAFKSLASVSQAYDSESRITAIAGFVGGILISALFGWVTIYLLNRLSEMYERMSL
jgi:hypothetical protein